MKTLKLSLQDKQILKGILNVFNSWLMHSELTERFKYESDIKKHELILTLLNAQEINITI